MAAYQEEDENLALEKAISLSKVYMLYLWNTSSYNSYLHLLNII
jgi:hypothetical protein